MVRRGEDLKGAATLHGLLATSYPAEKGAIQTPLAWIPTGVDRLTVRTETPPCTMGAAHM